MVNDADQGGGQQDVLHRGRNRRRRSRSRFGGRGMGRSIRRAVASIYKGSGDFLAKNNYRFG